MKWMTCAVSVLVLMGMAVVSAETPESHYRIANRIGVEGDGFWDLLAVDDSTGRLFLSHSTMVQVVDTKTGKLVGVIPDTKGVHGIALARDLNKGFATCGKDTTVAIFDLKTLAVLARVTVTGENPDAILYEPVFHRVFVFNGGGGNATVIDAKSNKVIGTVTLDGKPELGASDKTGTVFVNLEDSSMVDVISADSLKVVQKWPLKPGEEPTGIGIDDVNHRLFITCHNKMMVVMSSENGKVIATLPIGERVDGAGFDPGLKRAYSSNGDGTLTVVQELAKDSFQVVENFATQKGARTMAINASTHHIFLPTAEFGETPAPTTEHPRPRPTIKPGSFVVLDVAPTE
jgi:DNA-binding beta-propeller fold protein YncE